MDFLIFLLGFLGLAVSLVILVINVVRKKGKKKVVMVMVAALIMMVAGLSMESSDNVRSEENVAAVTKDNGPEPEEKIKQSEEIEKVPTPETSPVEELVSIPAMQLYQEYKDNEVAADNKYKKETLEITGTIENIGKDVFDTIYITLDVGEYFDSVQCFFKSTESGPVAELSKGQEVTVIGRCEGLALSTVMVKNSKIKE